MSISQKIELLFGEERSQKVERNPVPDIFDATAVDGFDAYQREILVAFSRGTDLTGNRIAALEAVILDLLLRYVIAYQFSFVYSQLFVL